jgi:ammonia channel protein AmtB
MFSYDDALDCFGFHAIGGIVAALLTGVFAVEQLVEPQAFWRATLDSSLTNASAWPPFSFMMPSSA